jgi:hypothetical protein
MRITIAHNKSKAEAIQAVDQAIDQAFRGLEAGPITVSDVQRKWEGSVLSFTLTARMGLLRNPIRGTVEVTDKDMTIDADLGILSKLLPQEQIQNALETGVRKLLV